MKPYCLIQPKAKEAYKFICGILENRGNLYAKTGYPEKAKVDYDKAAQIRRRFVHKVHTIINTREMENDH